MMEEF